MHLGGTRVLGAAPRDRRVLESPHRNRCPRTLPRFYLQGYQFQNNHLTGMYSGSEAGSYLRLTDTLITQLKAQGPSRTCSESEEESMQVIRTILGPRGYLVPALLSIGHERTFSLRAAVERIWHMCESQGQILVLAFR